MREIAEKRGKTISQVAINWCICKGAIPIPGVKSLQQAQDNLGALSWQLNGDEVARLELIAEKAPRGMIQNIFQTV
jgi:pyridoxine 4-dehydrogenase